MTKLIIITTSCMLSTMDLQKKLRDAISKLDPHAWRFTCQRPNNIHLNQDQYLSLQEQIMANE